MILKISTTFIRDINGNKQEVGGEETNVVVTIGKLMGLFVLVHRQKPSGIMVGALAS